MSLLLLGVERYINIMKVTSKIEKVEKVVEVEEKIITMEMTETEARRLMAFLGCISHDAFKNKILNNDLAPSELALGDDPSMWDCYDDTTIFYSTLYKELYES